MLNLLVGRDGEWWLARITVSGTCVDPRAGEWERGRTRAEALKKLGTKLRREIQRVERAHYRLSACLALVERAEKPQGGVDGDQEK